jgi:NhaP-type Na+/H+ or K+/H+ antiporter
MKAIDSERLLSDIRDINTLAAFPILFAAGLNAEQQEEAQKRWEWLTLHSPERR